MIQETEAIFITVGIITAVIVEAIKFILARNKVEMTSRQVTFTVMVLGLAFSFVMVNQVGVTLAEAMATCFPGALLSTGIYEHILNIFGLKEGEK